jgi:hypothetical protein
MLVISWVAAQLAASQEGFSSMSEWLSLSHALQKYEVYHILDVFTDYIKAMIISCTLMTIHEHFRSTSFYLHLFLQGTRYSSWLRHYATNRMVAASILYEVTGFFNWPNPYSRTMALGSIQTLRETSTRNLLWGKGRSARKADNLTAICEPNV